MKLSLRQGLDLEFQIRELLKLLDYSGPAVSSTQALDFALQCEEGMSKAWSLDDRRALAYKMGRWLEVAAIQERLDLADEATKASEA